MESAMDAEENANEPYYTLKDAAKILGLPYHQLLKHTKNGNIKGSRLFGRRIYVLLSAIRRLFNNNILGS
jgi:hypothetical protein